MERVDGAQARLKLLLPFPLLVSLSRGKGGWGSGEIETMPGFSASGRLGRGKGGWGSGEIETVDTNVTIITYLKWKGWMGLRRD